MRRAPARDAREGVSAEAIRREAHEVIARVQGARGDRACRGRVRAAGRDAAGAAPRPALGGRAARARSAGEPRSPGVPRPRLTAAVREALGRRARAGCSEAGGARGGRRRRSAARGRGRAHASGLFSLRPRDQRHRRGAPHEPGPRAALARWRWSGCAAVAAALLQPRDGPRPQGARLALRATWTALLRRLTGAEAALVVNNCAAAVLLALETPRPRQGGHRLARRADRDRRRVPHPRHHAPRRAPCCARWAPPTARTSRTTPTRSAPRPALLLKVHTSNYRVVGFTAAVSSRELAELGRERGIPVMEDLGSGCLVDLRPLRLPLRADRARGRGLRRGPGLVLRRQAAGRPAGRHRGRPRRAGRAPRAEPARTARCASTSSPSPRSRPRSTPTRRGPRSRPSRRCACSPSRSRRSGAARARGSCAASPPEAQRRLGAQLVEATSQVGGGALPTVELPTAAVAARHRRAPRRGARRGAARRATRRSSAASLDDRLLLDCRTVLPADVPALAGAPRAPPVTSGAEARRRRHRRAHRPRQDLARQGAHRHRHRPPAGGEGARHHDRPRLRLPRGARRARRSRSSTCPATSASSRTCWPASGGIDLALLVIAADEGVMPQTREHLAICSAPAHQAGLVALTKADLVEPDWLELVRDDVRARCSRGTFLAGAPIVPGVVEDGRGAARAARGARATWPRRCPRKDPDQHRAPADRPRLHRQGLRHRRHRHARWRGASRSTSRSRSFREALQAKVRGLQVHGHAGDRRPAPGSAPR